ncbi:MAG: HRDC domain-containing protein [Candidatus Sumerlaeia bacterium]|nr:HRDC domain-containing protein [Candidatus Sumerlaeia bacterium]
MFKVKIFKVRLNEQFQAEDESWLNDFLESVKPVDIQSAVINTPTEKFWTVFIVYEELEDAQTQMIDRVLYDTSEPLTPEEEELYLRLRSWRDQKARQENLPPYMILHPSHLKAIVKTNPRTRGDFRKIVGMSLRKIEKYADEILEFLRMFNP